MNTKDQKLKSSLFLSYGIAVGLTVASAVVSVVMIILVSKGMSSAAGAVAAIMAAVIAAAVSIAVAAVIGGKIVSGYNSLCEKAEKISKSGFYASSNANEGFKAADDALNNVGASISAFTADLLETSKLVEDGEINARLNEEKYDGVFVCAAEAVNNVIDCVASKGHVSSETVRDFARGDFSSEDGFLSPIAERLDQLAADIEKTAQAIKGGRPDAAADLSNYPGDWGKIAAALNSVTEEIKAPLEETADNLQKLAEGKLDLTFNCDYSGTFAAVRSGIEGSVSTMSAHINEIAEILTRMSQYDFNVFIKNDYPDSFTPIREALNLIISSFNSMADNISHATENFASGTSSIVKSSYSLAEGLASQMNSLDSLTSFVHKMYDSANENNKYANEANSLALLTKKNTSLGAEQMHLMLDSMTEISNASTGIANIIKVIEDIAFQTNILALNASVEAARAGQHGKGFSVVAEEVRNLANRSHNAAQETSSLIEDSLRMISEGSENANNTFETLEKILSEIDNMSSLIQKCAETSSAQEQSVKEIAEDISKISRDLLADSNTSRSAAGEATRIKELTAELTTLADKFKTKNSEENKEDNISKNEITENKDSIKSAGTESAIKAKTEIKAKPAKKKPVTKESTFNIGVKEVKASEVNSSSAKNTKAKEDDSPTAEEVAAAQNELHDEIAKLNSIGESQSKPTAGAQNLSRDKAPAPMRESKPVLKGLNAKAPKVKPSDEADESEFNRSDFGKY